MNLIKHLKNIYHYILASLGRVVFRNPSKGIYIIGVTGTKGKTTTIELINAGLEEAGYKTALNSSLRRKIGSKSEPNKGNSMPGRFYLQNFLKKALKEGCDFALVEVTSEGVAQHRHRGIDFDAGVFINLHPEHIESHGSFEKYRDAKVKFFKYVSKSPKEKKSFFINFSDLNFKHFAEAAKRGKVSFFFKTKYLPKIEGDFNLINAGAAESVLRAIGVKEQSIKKAIESFEGVPGRMEKVWDDPKVYIDYAHTPGSLKAVYESLSNQGKKKLICVVSATGTSKTRLLKATGSRDKWKRPEFGKIASEYCKEIILTDEDPFDEDPNQILSEIESGISNFEFRISNLHKILDRREAIHKAINLAKPSDTVVITGKGSEPHIRVKGGRKIPWSDKKVALEALESKS